MRSVALVMLLFVNGCTLLNIPKIRAEKDNDEVFGYVEDDDGVFSSPKTKDFGRE